MKIIIGLGNPGKKYALNRHNIGFLALDTWLGEVNWSLNKKFSSLIYKEGDYLFVKPQTFMNNSGQVVQKILSYYHLLPTRWGILKKKGADLKNELLVVHDDLDFNFGDWRLATDSSSAGHRGVQSIIDYLKSQKFSRLRLGIKNNDLRLNIPPEKFVLQNFNHEEQKKLKPLLSETAINKIIYQ